MHRVCAWCGRLGSDLAGPQSETTHGMCAPCVREWKDWRVPAQETRRQRAERFASSRGATEPPGLEIDTARSTNGRVI